MIDCLFDNVHRTIDGLTKGFDMIGILEPTGYTEAAIGFECIGCNLCPVAYSRGC